MNRHKMLKFAVVALTVLALVVMSVALAVAAPLQLGVAINPTGRVDNPTGVVTLTGTVTCDVPVSVSLFGQLTQPVGRKTLLQGSFFTSVNCTGGTTPWSATVSAFNGRFGGGPAQAFVSASGCSLYPYFDCKLVQTSATVKLRGGK